MDLKFEINPIELPRAEDVLVLFKSAGISKPNWSVPRLNKAIAGSSVIVCVHQDKQLIGFASALTDFAWVSYISQLAVDPKFQKQGIGKKIIQNVVEFLGDEVAIVVHSSTMALNFYKSVGFEPYQDVFKLSRKK